jgi:hypothetical protein
MYLDMSSGWRNRPLYSELSDSGIALHSNVATYYNFQPETEKGIIRRKKGDKVTK